MNISCTCIVVSPHIRGCHETKVNSSEAGNDDDFEDDYWWYDNHGMDNHG